MVRLSCLDVSVNAPPFGIGTRQCTIEKGVRRWGAVDPESFGAFWVMRTQAQRSLVGARTAQPSCSGACGLC